VVNAKDSVVAIAFLIGRVVVIDDHFHHILIEVLEELSRNLDWIWRRAPLSIPTSM
jgi:hypothetical protein